MSNVAAGKDTDDEGESLNDVETTLNSLGITLRKSQYEWKSFEDVLDEVASKWNVFEDTEQSKIATAIAGVRQQENFRALMNNWEEVKDLTDVAANSMGSASEKMEIYLDSVEAKTNEVKATWEEFILKLNQSDSYKGMLDIVIFLIDNLPTVATLLSSLLVTWKSFSIANNLKNQAIAMREMLALAINTETMAKNLSAAATANENTQESQSITLKSYKSAQLSALIAAKKAETLATETNIIAEQTETATTETNTVAEQMNTVAEQTNTIATEQSTQKRVIKKAVTLQGTAVENTNTTATEMNTTATEANIIAEQQKIKTAITLKTVLSGLATVIGVVTAAISIASIGIMAYQSYIQGLQDTVSETTQKIDALQDEIDELDSAINKYDEIIKSTGSAAEQKESLTKLQEQLISTYGEEAKALDLVNGKYENQIQILKNLQKDKLAQQIQEYTNSQSDRDKLLNTSTVNVVVNEDDIGSYEDDLIDKVKSIVAKNGGTFGKNLDGDYGIWATGETLPQIYEALEDYQKELIKQGDKTSAQKIADMFNNTNFGTASMKSDYEKFKEASNQERQKDLAQFQLDNYDDFQNYKDLLQKRNDLYKQYTESQNEEEKQKLLKNLEDVSKEALDKKASLYEKINSSNINGLADSFEDFFSEYNLDNLFKTDPTALSYFDELADKVGKTTEAGKNITIFGQKVEELDKQFETGKITATQYFEGINKQIDSIDLDKIDLMYGGIKNFNTMLSSIAGNTASYIETIMNSFGSGNMEEFEFFDNLSAAVNSFDKIVTTIENVDKKGLLQNGAVYDYNSFKDTFYGKEKQRSDLDVTVKYFDENGNEISTDSNGNPVVKPAYKESTYSGGKIENEEVNIEYQKLNEEYEKTLNEFSHKQVYEGLKEGTKEYKAYEEQLESINNRMKEINEGTKGVDDAMQDLKSSMKEINDMDFKGLDEAYENLNQAFADGKLKNTVDMTLDQVDSKLKDSAIKMATFLKEQVNSSNSEYSESAKNALDTMGLMADASVDSIATAIINNTTNLNAAANAGNKIAATAMGKTIQNLGIMLSKLGDAMDGFDISIPIKIPMIKLDLESFKNGGGLFTASDKNLLETEIKIGAAGTIKSIGNMLANADIADTIGNMFTPIEAPIKTKSGTSGSKGYTPSGGGSKKGSGSEYSAEDAASDLKDILQDIEDYEADIELDLEDQTEQLINHYNLEKNKLDTLKEELDYYDSIYDVTENTTKWLDTQLKILDEESKKVAEIQNANDKIDKQRQKIYNENSSLNVQSWFDSEGNETLAYGNLLNSFEYRKNQIEKETAAAMRAEYDKVANSTDKDTISAAKDKIKQIEEEGDIKIKQIDKERDYVENVYDSVSQLNDAWKDNQEAIREALQELNDRVKSIRDELIDDIMEQLERAVDKMNTSIEKDVTRLEQLKQVQESYNSILNDTIDTQQELEDELKANMDSYQYLDETMRQLMFNEDDYKQLSGVLEGIQSDIANIWEDHYNQIQNLTEDEMYKAEYITNETERQLAAKQKEYDLAKAELDVAKAQTNLNNVKNERNTRIFANGEWQWVANPDDVKSAQQQLMEAEREKTRIEREAEQQLLIDAMDKMIDSDNLQIDKNNELLENIQDAIEKETEEVKSIEEALLNADKANLPTLTTTLIGALGSDGGYMKELLGEINHSQVELAAALRGQTVQQAIDQLKSGTMNQSEFEELVTRLGYSFNPVTGMITTQDGSFAAHYKGWTKKSNNDVQLGTAENGVQVTGGQAGSGQSNAATSGGNGGGNSFPKNGRVTTNSQPLRIRSGAGTQYRILGLMPKGANVEILGEANSGWAQVRYGGITGYASRQYLHYDQGGIANGMGLFSKATLKPERVLSPRQTKAFENLVNNLTTNPVLNALSRAPSVNSKLGNLAGKTNNSKNYYFSNFTVQADDIQQFINSIETIMPINNK